MTNLSEPVQPGEVSDIRLTTFRDSVHGGPGKMWISINWTAVNRQAQGYRAGPLPDEVAAWILRRCDLDAEEKLRHVAGELLEAAEIGFGWPADPVEAMQAVLVMLRTQARLQSPEPVRTLFALRAEVGEEPPGCAGMRMVRVLDGYDHHLAEFVLPEAAAGEMARRVNLVVQPAVAEQADTYRDGVEAALRAMRVRHYPRQVSVISPECSGSHDHDEHWSPPRDADCYAEETLCAGCGTNGCKELPLVEALLEEACETARGSGLCGSPGAVLVRGRCAKGHLREKHVCPSCLERLTITALCAECGETGWAVPVVLEPVTTDG